jgi:hypothetical protein
VPELDVAFGDHHLKDAADVTEPHRSDQCAAVLAVRRQDRRRRCIEQRANVRHRRSGRRESNPHDQLGRLGLYH